MAVDLDELIKRDHTLMLKIIEYDVSLQPAYLSMGYPVLKKNHRFTELEEMSNMI